MSLRSIAERGGELPGPVAEVPERQPAPALGHDLDAQQRLEGPDQDGAGDALGLADEVEHVVVAVGEVDVRRTGRAVHDGVALA